ncbi:MAG: ABC transporter ATP-binding protein [Synergistaceae bacterium]|nr:ABC transporter ATP-binding protein [Synergistaceae bacterium]
MCVVRVENLGFSYGGEPVFSQVSFAVRKGDFVVVIGANGAGKSTLFRLILGELASPKGKIRLFGDDSRPRERRAIGYLPQNGSLANGDFPATVEEIVMSNLFLQIGFLRFPKKEHREKVRESLERVGMAAFAKRLIGDLSGGQRQRVMLARALVSDPELLMLDEPTSGVDLPSIVSMFELLSRMNGTQGITVMMITHDVDNILEYASRVLCLEKGSLVELEKTQFIEELSHKHKHPARSREGAKRHGSF